MTRYEDFDDLKTVAQFEGGSVHTAKDGDAHLLITDESALASVLGTDDADLLDRLVSVHRFATAIARDRATASLLAAHVHSQRGRRSEI